jgi:hypothetical protein
MSGAKTAVVLLLAGVAAGCVSHTMSDVIQGKAQATPQVYPVSEDQAWKIAIQVFRWEGTDAIEEHRDEHMLLTAQNQRSSYSSAEASAYLGAWVEPVGAGSTKVSFVAKAKTRLGYVYFTEATFHERFRQAVGILQSGKPLPLDAPPRPAPALSKCESSSDCSVGICLEGFCR